MHRTNAPNGHATRANPTACSIAPCHVVQCSGRLHPPVPWPPLAHPCAASWFAMQRKVGLHAACATADARARARWPLVVDVYAAEPPHEVWRAPLQKGTSCGKAWATPRRLCCAARHHGGGSIARMDCRLRPRPPVVACCGPPRGADAGWKRGVGSRWAMGFGTFDLRRACSRECAESKYRSGSSTKCPLSLLPARRSLTGSGYRAGSGCPWVAL